MLVEREHELEVLHQAHAKIALKGGNVVLIYGEAGIGKTSLVQTFLDDLQPESPIAQGLCDPLSTPRPMGPIRDVARSVMKLLPDGEQSLFDGMVETLTDSPHRHVIVLEDMHWADQASLDWLQYFGRRISQLPVMLLVTFRHTDVDPAHPLRSALGVIPSQRTHRLHLQPLSINAVAGMNLPPGMSVTRLYEITNGNAFFISEILGNPQDAVSVPESIVDAVNARINLLNSDPISVLEVCSCFPARIDPDYLEEVVGRSVLSEVAELEKRQFLTVTDDGYRFRHELARLATLQRLSEIDRQHVHSRLLDILLKQEDAQSILADIIHHGEGAGDHHMILRYSPKAAQQAAAVGAHREAAQYLSIAIRHIDHAEPEIAASILESWAYEAGLSLAIDEDVIAAREQAIGLWKALGRQERVGDNLRWLSRLHWYRGEPDKAQSYLEDAIEVLQQEQSETSALTFGLRAQFHMLRDEMDAAETWGLKALDIARSVDAPEVIVHALNTIGSARLFRGKLDGEESLRESLKISLHHGLHEQAARVYTNLSECLIELGQLDKAERLIEEGITFDTAHDLDAWTYYLVGRKAQLRFEQDRFAESVDIARGVLSRENQTILMQLPARIYLARSLLRTGDNEAPALLEAALADALQVGELQYIAVVRTALVEAAALWDKPSVAEPHIAELRKLPLEALSARKWVEFLFWARRSSVDCTSDLALPTSAAFKADSEGDYERAAALFKKDGSRYFAAIAIASKGSASALAMADELFSDIDAQAGRKYIRLLFTEHAPQLPALARGPYAVARNHPYGLTKKEQDVLSLIVDGHDNSHIASTMSRSKRTIENHVSSILVKFGVRNRLELVLRVQAEPWLVVKAD